MKLFLIRGNIGGYYQLQVNADDIAGVCTALSHCLFQLILTGIKKLKGLIAQSCLTLYDPMDCSPPGSPVRGILQARILEKVGMPSSKGSFWSRHRTQSPALQVDSLPSEPPEKPYHSVLTLPQVLYIWYLPIWTTTIKGKYYSYPHCGVKKKAQGFK